MRFTKLLVAIALVVGLVSSTFAADGIAKFTFGDDQYLELHYLLQVQAYSQQTKDSTTGDKYWSKDSKIRRSRVILKGQAAQGVEFFMETDAPNQDGTARTNLFTQDAYIDFTIAKELKIAFGHILLPFMHHDRQSAATLLCADYTTAVVPVGGNVWRDTGVEFRGLLGGGIVDYRIGVFDGNDRNKEGTLVKNKNDMPRYTGRIQVNLKDAEDGFFYSGNYLGKKSIISFGFGVDYQQDIYAVGTKVKDYTAWTADVYFDHPIAANNVLTLQGAYVNVKDSPFFGTEGVKKADMYFVEGGFLINGALQPVARYYYKKTESSDGVESKISEVAGGLNYYIKGHNANIKAEYAQEIKDESGSTKNFKDKKITVQCQILI